MSKTITFRGTPIQVGGEIPAVGGQCPDFRLTNGDLTDVTLADFAGKRKVLNIFPSVDTGVCATSVRQFNAEASKLENTVVLCISADLPFAQKRFCASEGLENVVNLSTFRHPEFKSAFGVDILTGAVAGLCARTLIVLDENNTVLYAQMTDEISSSVDFEAGLKVLK